MAATQKEKDDTRKAVTQPHGQGQARSSSPTSNPIFSSPHKGESCQNKYVELVNLEETQEESREVQDDHEEPEKSVPVQANLETPEKGISNAGKGDPSPSKIP
jgi:hypothetical protein